MKQKYLSIFISAFLLFVNAAGVDAKAARTVQLPAQVSKNVTFSDNVVIGVGKTVIVKNFATIVAKKDLTINGTLRCDNSPLLIEVRGALIVRGTLECYRTTLRAKNDIGNSIVIVAKRAVFATSAVVVANGHVQLVDDKKKMILTQKQLDQYYTNEKKDSRAPFQINYPQVLVPPVEGGGAGPGGGPGKGPVPKKVVPLSTCTITPPPAKAKSIPGGAGAIGTPPPQGKVNPPANIPQPLQPLPKGREGCIDRNGEPVKDCIQIGGSWVLGGGAVPSGKIMVPPPPKGVKKIILYYGFGQPTQAIFKNLEIVGPDALDGDDDPLPGKKPDCNATGKDGQPALQLSSQAPMITINNFILRLGRGGNGGNATTDVCTPQATARGGNGGVSGNIKMEATKSFRIERQFCLFPGDGGNGGSANAYGADGISRTVASKDPALCNGENGGSATAHGGKGGDNTKELRVYGKVQGIGNIFIGSLIAGKGGNAAAKPGKGGDGFTNGGQGGDAVASGGGGGNAHLTYPRFAGVQRVKGSVDQGGEGGDANVKQGIEQKDGTGGVGAVDEPHGTAGTSGGKTCGEEPDASVPDSGTSQPSDNVLPPPYRFYKDATLVYGEQYYLIVEGSTITSRLPITFSVLVDGRVQDLPKPTVDSADECGTGACSAWLPKVQESWRGKRIEFRAVGKDGEVLTTWVVREAGAQ